MDSLCTPAVATAALFVAVLFLDLFRRDFSYLPAHAVFGVLSVTLMSILCKAGYANASWALLAAPFVLLLLGWMIQGVQPKAATAAAAAAAPAPPSPKYCQCNGYLRIKLGTGPCGCLDPTKLKSA